MNLLKAIPSFASCAAIEDGPKGPLILNPSNPKPTVILAVVLVLLFAGVFIAYLVYDRRKKKDYEPYWLKAKDMQEEAQETLREGVKASERGELTQAEKDAMATLERLEKLQVGDLDDLILDDEEVAEERPEDPFKDS